MNRIIYLPFENLPQRYTQMWNDSITSELDAGDIVISGDTEERVITSGEFLDTCQTIRHKQSQIDSVAALFQEGKIKDGDVFFVPDVFYSGLSSIKYIAELIGIKVFIVAFNHAGRADEHDFVQKLGKWSETQERAWHEMSDIILVGSNYHREKVRNFFNIDNVESVGAVWSKAWMDSYTKELNKTRKENYIIFPHRPCKEKRFDFFLEVAKKNPNLKFVITSCGANRLVGVELPKNVEYRYGLTKKEYYQTFAFAKGYLSTAYQETFGYTLQEAIYFNCQVIVPDFACYKEYADRSSIVSFDNMMRQGYLTTMYQKQDLRRSPQFRDNAKSIINICRNIK